MVKRIQFATTVFSPGDLEVHWFVRHEDVLAALQTLIDQLANNHEWRNGAVLAYNAISCSEIDAKGNQ